MLLKTLNQDKTKPPVALLAVLLLTFVFELHASALLSDEPAESAEQDNRVTVTAQKRVQLLKDVPLAVTVVSGEQIDKEVIIDLEELSGAVPNLTINEAGISTNLFIRGVGSGVNQGFEQSVGTYIDGVYFGRARSARAVLFDIERVEVLKGPQDTLFGKNAIAGALNISTRLPEPELSGFFEASTEPEFDGAGIRAVINDGIGDNLSTRLAIMYHEEDGALFNTTKKRPETQKKDQLLRSSWLWTPNDRTDILIKLEKNRFDTLGRNVVVSVLPQSLLAYTASQRIDPLFEPQFGLVNSIGGTSGLGDEYADNSADLASVKIDYALAQATLTSLSAYSYYSVREAADVDVLPISFLNLKTEQQHQQISQELRLTSSHNEPLNYVLGIYLQQNELKSIRRADINGLSLELPFSGRRHNQFSQKSENYALFGQVSWRINENWQINGGMRYSKDRKELFKQLYIAELLNDKVNTDPTTNSIFRTGLNIVPHTFSHQSQRDGVPIEFDPVRKESNLSPSLSLQYFSAQEWMWYASLAKGFKGGGFDEDNTGGLPDREAFDEESVIAMESGFKWANSATHSFNLAVFKNQYDNLQVSTFDGVAGFNVGNAAKAISQGIEIDGRWQYADAWQLNYALTYLDAFYDSYREGQCTNALAHCSALGFQDLSGKPLQFAPEWAATIELHHHREIAENWLASFKLGLVYSDEFQIPGDLDPLLAQSAFTKINARIQIGDVWEDWYISIIGKNLTNKLTTSWGNDIALAPGGFFQFVDPPRSVEFQLHWTF